MLTYEWKYCYQIIYFYLQKSLIRIQIEEIGGDNDNQRQSAIEEVKKSQSEAKKLVTSQDNKIFEQFTTSDKTVDRNSSEQLESEKTSESSIKLDLKEITSSITEESKSVSPRSMPVPSSSFQFQTDYKMLKTDLKSFYVYIKVSIHGYFECYMYLNLMT